MECGRAVGIFERWRPSLGLALTMVISIHVRAEAAHFTGLSASLMAHHDLVPFSFFCPVLTVWLSKYLTALTDKVCCLHPPESRKDQKGSERRERMRGA